MIADGIFGVNPAIYDELLKYYGIKTKTTFFVPRELDTMAQSGKTATLCYFNDKDDISQGAHYINITWDTTSGKYVAYNAPEKEFDSIEEYLKNNDFKLISLTTIN